MSLISIVNSVRAYLATQHMLVDEEWLSGCVEYLMEDSSQNYSESDVKNLAKEQWLLNDLKDICPGSLPTNLRNHHKIILNGKFVLQINACMDIGTPAYQQYMKLQKINQENVDATTKFEDKVPSHRMIKLYLTDGVQEVSAIEYKPMRNLNCDITPGCKVLLKGPIECRRGIFLLTESVIELLGGEVQEIASANSLSGLLSSKLGLPATVAQDPDLNTTISCPRNTNIPTPHAQMPSSLDSRQQEPIETSRPVARVTSIQVANFADDEIDIDQLDALEAQYSNISKEHASLQSNSNTKRTMTFESNGDTSNIRPNQFNNDSTITMRTESIPDTSKRLFDFESKDQCTVSGSKRLLQNAIDPKPEKKLKMQPENNPDDYPDDNDLFFEDDDYLREMEANFDAKEIEMSTTRLPEPVSSEPFVYIKQINDMKESEKAGRVFRVKGQILKLLSKLSLGKDGWSLSCTITDGTGNLDVDITSVVLSKLVGYTPQEMSQMKKEMVNNPDLKAKAVSTLQKAKDTLQVLYCIIELTILEVPKITYLTPFADVHVELLKKRKQKYML